MTQPRKAVRHARPSSGRVTYFDWLRGLATLAVVVLHMCNKVLTDHPVYELGVPMVLAWTELQLLLTRWAVPVFLMVSGALLLDPRRQPEWPKLGRYIARMLGVLAVFCPVYACMSARAISFQAIAKGLGDALCQGSWDHLWYVYALIGLYLLTPMLAGFVRAASRRMQRDTLAVLAVITLALPTASSVTGAPIARLGWVGFPVFYYLLGSYLHRYLRLDGRVRLVGLGSLVVCALACAAIVCLQWRYPKWLIIPESPLVAAWSAYVFLAVREAVGQRVPPRAIASASRLSLAVYLLHPLVIITLYRRLWWMPYETFPPVVFELVVLAITYGVTFPVASLLQRAPVLRKIL